MCSYKLFIGRVLITFSSWLNIKIAYNRLISLRDQQMKFKTKVENSRQIKIYSMLFCLFSIVFHSPNLFLFLISQKQLMKNETSTNTVCYYEIEFNENANKNLTLFIYGLQFAIVFSNLILIVVCSIMTILCIRKKCDKLINELMMPIMDKVRSQKAVIKKIETNRILGRIKHLESQTNKMILYMSVIFIINECVTLIGSIFEFYLRNSNLSFLKKFILIFMIFVYVSNCSANTFVYLKYSKAFKNNFKNLFKIN